ncbi:hypothetical protein, variant 2 [Aphanomyces invadans]|uniref:RRM domain-containing protein n=1 Tax=Aphanomyces invadans TaxID=157072 RepID=A0A024U2Q3_9STRA|nr:hypothetical protein H310_07101 [Aphanomyces invadans]XP_008870620.1 hypothetical protein, variant 1 [Aphanomyces invadans]XP_008870621.1 hypothetical protein, variant 2 [Aphanomyces invadans]ETW00484.1 hypothetical protein H310_07101 [Aphanomyces invadans]ETW00485.1 hypothetical protein, variant 1 [Aphanomyces invadans]ETW00486.1 hypothetical protein, variant 2 [Aphanomyces invadans]|eukprot:XP_008870619.1 hypothetical protein H310_07101 [Aphanomyces invadans]
MDLYGDLDKYTATGGAGLGFSATPAQTSVKLVTPAAPTANPTSSKNETPAPTKSSAGTTSALKFIPRRRREEPAPRPSPVATGLDNASSVATRFSPANAATTSLKTSLGMAAFTPVSVTRTKLSTDVPPLHSDDGSFDNRAVDLHRPDSVQEEYDPCRPNDYATFCEEREIREKNAEVRADLERRQKRLERERLREREQLEKDLEAGRVPNLATTSVPGGRGRGMNLPAWMMKKIEGSADDATTSSAPTRPPSSPLPTSALGQFDDAVPGPSVRFDSNAKSTRSSKQDSVSRGSAAREPSPHHEPTRSAPVEGVKKGRLSRFGQRSDVESGAPPKKQSVLLLLNMVAPGDVDDDLKDEVKEECEGKYGPVVDCVVFEVPFRVAPEEAVRIFVEFQHEADAAKAMAGLNGRFFGGRKLTVTKFDKALFDRRDLAP